MVELFREEPEEELGLRIVGGKDTPLGNIVIQEIVRDSLAARDGRLAPGDHILEVRRSHELKDERVQFWKFTCVPLVNHDTYKISTFLHKLFVITFS